MKTFFTILLVYIVVSINAQSLLDELNNEINAEPDTIYTMGTFKATRLINGQSVETAGKNGLNFVISHRFGNVKTGAFDFFGLDVEGHIRFGLEYGATKKLDIGIGRGNDEKLYNGFFKYKLLRQSSGAINMPISLSWYSSVAITADQWQFPKRDNIFSSRLSYVHEAIVARKFSERFSAQVIPGIVHLNLVKTKEDENIVLYSGFGCRYKLTKRIAFSTEYYYIISNYTASQTVDPLSIGFDIETGGHIFQLHLSNARGLNEKIMLTENKNKWDNLEFGLGFNIIRNFDLSKR